MLQGLSQCLQSTFGFLDGESYADMQITAWCPFCTSSDTGFPDIYFTSLQACHPALSLMLGDTP